MKSRGVKIDNGKQNVISQHVRKKVNKNIGQFINETKIANDILRSSSESSAAANREKINIFPCEPTE